MNKRVLSLLVDNTSGVLSRIAGLFSRRGYNIDSLTVGETADPRYSRMTVVVNGDDKILDQITKQLAKLVDVVDIKPVAVMVGHLVGGDGRAILDDNHLEASRRLPGKALQQLLHLVRAVEDGDDQGD